MTGSRSPSLDSYFKIQRFPQKAEKPAKIGALGVPFNSTSLEKNLAAIVANIVVYQPTRILLNALGIEPIKQIAGRGTLRLS